MWTAWTVSLWLADALAQPTAVGLFVGSNRPGPGQERLRYAIDDAHRVQRVMTELGGLDEGGRVLEDPDVDELRAALAERAARLRALQRSGERTVFVFYYSGHARSRALTLGRSELLLTELRAELEAMPSTVTVAVLDACQSGAISGVKGVEPASGFSFNSSAMLHAEGIAVMASSTGSELSQESDGVRGSFFTHHLVTGLRGPADEDRDGSVSLDEAYRYAFRETLVATTPTRVGSQHATLETQLRGHGHLALTRPGAAGASLVFDGPPGRILALRQDTGAVVAEVTQTAEAVLTVAVGAGDYRLVGTDDVGPYVCEARLVDGVRLPVSELSCTRQELPLAPIRVKRPSERRQAYHSEVVGVEIAGGVLRSAPGGAYLDRLGTFGFVGREPGRLDAPLSPVVGVSLGGRLTGRWAWTVAWSTLERAGWARDWRVDDEVASEDADALRWQASRIGVYPRYTLPLRGDQVLLALQAGPGVTLGTETLQTAAELRRSGFVGGHLAAAVALHVVARGPAGSIGPFVQADAVWAPALRNDLGDQRNLGGLGLSLGVRVTP